MSLQKIFLFFALLIVTPYMQAQNGSVLVRVEGVKNTEGKIQIGLYNDPEDFPNFKESYAVGAAVPNTQETTFVFKDVEPGNYVIALWHDQNNDQKLTTNMFGIPKEKYGFSNNASGIFGPPKFKDASFTINAEENTILTIKLK